MAKTRYNLILLNDNVNSMQDIIRMVSTVCCYSSCQAEQIVTLAHHRGAAELKENLTAEECLQYIEIFTELGLKVEDEKI